MSDTLKNSDISGLIDSIDNIFTELNDVLWLYDVKNDILRVSDKINKICSQDYSLHIKSCNDFMNIVYTRDQSRLHAAVTALYQKKINNISTEIRIICSDNELKYFKLNGRCIEIDNDEGSLCTFLTGTMVNIDEEKRREDKIKNISYTDLITQLPNRSMFIYKTSVTINRRDEDLKKCAVINLNLDNFKRINDIYGYYIGDDVLRAVGSIISAAISKTDMLARFDGDGFFLLLPKFDNYIEAEVKAKKLLKSLSRKLSVKGIDIILTCSAGIAVYPSDGETAEQLITNANSAMHKAKENGKNCISFFKKSINYNIQKKIELENQLQNAVINNEFYLVYQPQIDIRNGNISGVEALIRWKNPLNMNISPAEFIPVLEDTELILSVGIWTVETACRQSKYWLDKKNIKIPVSVNVSPVQLKCNYFAAAISDILKKTGLPCELLRLEITEGALIKNFQNACRIFERLRKEGIKIALDDFGTGYCSLNYIKSLPLDILKIDKSFIDGLTENKKEKAIIGSIIDMAHFLELKVVAEGIEREEQYKCIKYLGCDIIQGYYFSRPILAEELEKTWINKSPGINQ